MFENESVQEIAMISRFVCRCCANDIILDIRFTAYCSIGIIVVRFLYNTNHDPQKTRRLVEEVIKRSFITEVLLDSVRCALASTQVNLWLTSFFGFTFVNLRTPRI